MPPRPSAPIGRADAFIILLAGDASMIIPSDEMAKIQDLQVTLTARRMARYALALADPADASGRGARAAALARVDVRLQALLRAAR